MNYNTNQCSEYAVKDTEGRNIANTLTELGNKPSGTKLYLHQINLNAEEIEAGSLVEGGAFPLYIVSNNPEPINFDDSISILAPYNFITGANDDGYGFTSLDYDASNNKISVLNGLRNGFIYYNNVSNVEDIVTPL